MRVHIGSQGVVEKVVVKIETQKTYKTSLINEYATG